MWAIPKPEITARECFDICIEGISDANKKARLEGMRQCVEEAENEFGNRAGSIDLHLIAEAAEVIGVSGNVTMKEMKNLYDRHMARQKSRGRTIYDKIMMAALHGQCPFCGHLPVSTLDHSLPKALYPALAVTPINLLPCCKDCNHNKGTAGPDAAETQFLHAYYDNFTTDRWLYAQILPGSPPGATFSVIAPDNWDAVTVARVSRHFSMLKLGKLYASQGGRQLQNIRKGLSLIYEAAGADAVRADLVLRAESCADVSINSWEGALYEAAAENQWFYNGGFR